MEKRQLIKKFARFLKEKKVWHKYLWYASYDIRKQFPQDNWASHLADWLIVQDSTYWLIRRFVWNHTDEGAVFWGEIHRAWCSFVIKEVLAQEGIPTVKKSNFK